MLLSDGAVSCWGSNGHGQLGIGNATVTAMYVPAMMNLSRGGTLGQGIFYTLYKQNMPVIFCYFTAVLQIFGSNVLLDEILLL